MEQKMDNFKKYPQDVRKVFMKCGSCSHTFFYLLNREFGHLKEIEEKASDMLAGGLAKTGHQCGMLWGSSLAVGAESFRRNSDFNQAIAITISTTQHIMHSFINRTKTPDCRNFTGCNFMKLSGLIKLGLKIIFNGNICFKLAENWAPEAIDSACEGLSKKADYEIKPVNCASELVRKMGGSNEEIVMVAGFAGGMGLSGNACGALGAAIWMKLIAWCKKHPGKAPPYFKNSDVKKILKAFHSVTDSEILCHKICGRQFKTIDEHTEFVKNGGCEKLINMLSRL
jgi:hypothetical protein